MIPYVQKGLDDFVGKHVPEVQHRGLIRREYEGKTPRENLGFAETGKSLLWLSNANYTGWPENGPWAISSARDRGTEVGAFG